MRIWAQPTGAGGGGASSITIQTDEGTSPVGNVFTFTSSDDSVVITGNSGTDTVNFQVAGISGFVVGPASSTDNALARFDSTTGKLIKNSVAILTDAGALSGLTTLNMSGQLTTTVATGTAPFAVSSVTLVTNLNADMVDGIQGTTLVVGAASSTDNAIVRFDSTNGKLIQNSLVTIDDSGNVTAPANSTFRFGSAGGTQFGDDSGLCLITAPQGIFCFCAQGDMAFLADNGNFNFTGVTGSFGATTITFEAKLATKTSGTGLIAKMGGVIFSGKNDANNGTTVETDLYTDTLPANCIVTVFDKIRARYAGVFNGDATSTQQIRAYLGGTLIFDSGALAIGVATPAWDLEVNIHTVSNSSVRVTCTYYSGSAVLPVTVQYTAISLTLSNTQILKVTGTAAGASGGSNQITGKHYYVEWLPAP